MKKRKNKKNRSFAKVKTSKKVQLKFQLTAHVGNTFIT